MLALAFALVQSQSIDSLISRLPSCSVSMRLGADRDRADPGTVDLHRPEPPSIELFFDGSQLHMHLSIAVG